MHFFHILNGEFFVWLDSISDDFFQSIGPSSRNFVKRTSVGILIRGKLIIAHGDITLFWIVNMRILIQETFHFVSRNGSIFHKPAHLINLSDGISSNYSVSNRPIVSNKDWINIWSFYLFARCLCLLLSFYQTEFHQAR